MNRDNVFCGSGMDPGLTSTGHETAVLFAQAFRSTPFKAIYVSPLKRARQTAHPLCLKLQVEPEVRDGLKEIGYGKWEGKTLEEIRREFPHEYALWSSDPVWYAPPDGEKAALLLQRAEAVIEEIQGRFDSGIVLIVSHKGTIRALLCHLLGIDLCRFRHRLACELGSLSIVEFARHGPLLHTLGNRAHLAPELRARHAAAQGATIL